MRNSDHKIITTAISEATDRAKKLGCPVDASPIAVAAWKRHCAACSRDHAAGGEAEREYDEALAKFTLAARDVAWGTWIERRRVIDVLSVWWYPNSYEIATRERI